MAMKGKKKRGAKAPRKVSKPLRRAIQSVVKAQVETKTINVPDFNSSGLTNTINKAYATRQGLQYLCGDVFQVRKGVDDDSTLLATNRIGDKIRGVGFLMDYMFSTQSTYSLAGNTYYIPFVKLRVVVWRQAQSTGFLSQALLTDTNFLQGNTSVLQPINWDEGFVKDVLYDKTHVIRNYQFTSFTQSGCIPSAQLPIANVFHFKKYFKYDHIIKFLDNQSSPNNTDKPINIAILAEVDDATSLVPSNQTVLYTTGYTRAWFKDA